MLHFVAVELCTDLECISIFHCHFAFMYTTLAHTDFAI